MTTGKDGAGPVVLLQITDPHLHAAADSRMRGVVTFDTFLTVIEQMQRDERWPPDAILATGDLVQDESRGGYRRFRSSLGDLGVPIYCVAGNHDDPALMHEILGQPPFQVDGEATLGAWLVIFLNTHVPGEDSGTVAEGDLARLQRRLAENPDKHVLICMHHQPVPMGSAWLDGVALSNAKALLEIVDRHAHVRGLVWGHVHQSSDRYRGNLRLLSTPSTCAQFLPGSDFFALDNRPPGYRWIALHPDGRIDSGVQWLTRVDGR
jgi:Icc protein